MIPESKERQLKMALNLEGAFGRGIAMMKIMTRVWTMMKAMKEAMSVIWRCRMMYLDLI